MTVSECNIRVNAEVFSQTITGRRGKVHRASVGKVAVQASSAAEAKAMLAKEVAARCAAPDPIFRATSDGTVWVMQQVADGSWHWQALRPRPGTRSVVGCGYTFGAQDEYEARKTFDKWLDDYESNL